MKGVLLGIKHATCCLFKVGKLISNWFELNGFLGLWSADRKYEGGWVSKRIRTLSQETKTAFSFKINTLKILLLLVRPEENRKRVDWKDKIVQIVKNAFKFCFAVKVCVCRGIFTSADKSKNGYLFLGNIFYIRDFRGLLEYILYSRL